MKRVTMVITSNVLVLYIFKQVLQNQVNEHVWLKYKRCASFALQSVQWLLIFCDQSASLGFYGYLSLVSYTIKLAYKNMTFDYVVKIWYNLDDIDEFAYLTVTF